MHGFSSADLWQTSLFLLWCKIMRLKKLTASLTETKRNDKSVFSDFTRVVRGTSLNAQPMNYRIIAS